MAVGIHYDVEGIGHVEHNLLAIGERAVEPRPVLELIAESMRGIEQKLFDAQGYGTWPPLAASTVARKGNSKILRDTDALMNSLTSRGAPGSHEEIFGSTLSFGTSVEYATFHRTGTSRMPMRDPLQIREIDLREFTRAVQTYLVGLERAEFSSLMSSAALGI